MQFPLNAAQRDAVRHDAAPLLVLAGAGSGKTRVITAKIAHLVERGIDASKIVAITFTNKAAREMRERARNALARSDASAAVTISTFHSFGLSIVRAEARALGLKSGFSIFDPADVEPIVAELAATADRARARAIQWKISQWKNALVAPTQALREAANDDEVVAARAYAGYRDALSAYQAVDFDDLIVLPVTLFDSDMTARGRWQARCAHVLIDEYQDTNPAQYRLFRHLVGEHTPFTAVGDDDQAIYGWRGATLDNLAALPRDFPNLRVIKLEQNYRSTVRILRCANALIGNNAKLFDKRLWTELGHGEPLRVVPAADEEAEAEGVVRRLLGHRFEHRTRFADYAILYRGNHQARAFETALRAQSIPYEISGGQSMFERTEIKDIVAYLRLIANENDDPAFVRALGVPKRGVGQASLRHLGEVAQARNTSLFGGVFEPTLADAVPARQRAVLTAFCALINGLRHRAEREPAGRLLDEMLRAIGYADWLASTLDRRDAQLRAQSVDEFVVACTQGRSRREEPARARADGRADHDARGARAGRARRGATVDTARREGPRVSARVPRGPRGGRAAASGGDRRGQRRGGAAPDVRGAHARARDAAPVVLRDAQARGREGRLRAVAIPRRAGAGGSALRRSRAHPGGGGDGEDGRECAAGGAEGVGDAVIDGCALAIDRERRRPGRLLARPQVRYREGCDW